MAQTKNSVLSSRVHPSTKFIAEFYARVSKRSQSSWLTEAVTILGEADQKKTGIDWHDYADVEEDVSEYLILVSGLPLQEDEKERAKFVAQHRPFFANKTGGKWKPDRKKIDILWPKLQHWVEAWYASKGDDTWAVGHEMAKVLKPHGIVVKWGPGVETE